MQKGRPPFAGKAPLLAAAGVKCVGDLLLVGQRGELGVEEVLVLSLVAVLQNDECATACFVAETVALALLCLATLLLTLFERLTSALSDLLGLEQFLVFGSSHCGFLLGCCVVVNVAFLPPMTI